MPDRVEFYKHNLGKTEEENLLRVLRSPILTTGPVTGQLEDQLSGYLGCRHVAAVSSGTAALFLALEAHGIGPGDEVITTPMTFIATPNAVLHNGARPVFVDVEKSTGNLNAERIEAAITPKTRAILPVHLYGQMCDMKAIRSIADRHGLFVIEDAAHALEAVRDGVRVGEMGDAACFSFYATKNITCGEGGAVGTDDPAVDARLRKTRLHGMSKGAAERYSKAYQHWDMELLGWKYNLDDIRAALLLSQLEIVDEYWRRREQICERYESAFRALDDVRLLTVLPGSKSGRHLFTILVRPKRRDEILARIQERGVGVAVNYRAVHLLTYYRERFNYARGMFPVAEEIGDSTITLPLYPKLSDENVEHVIDAVTQAVQNWAN
ncbi:MAG: DegT/DnrJ/EryC1/StrS family aminotransferase [Planctomycetota bacterium]